MSNNFDSYIFDMDGTLWDAVDSYCRVWNQTIADCGLESCAPVTRPRLEQLMGKPLTEIERELIGNDVPEFFMEKLQENEISMMPHLGGTLYPGVADTIRELHRNGAKLFMVSNCQKSGLPNFLRYTGLEPYFTDWVSFGDNGQEKDVNIRTLVERYNLKHPVYVGDTAGDMRSTHAAGLPFAWASYGFGHDLEGAEYILKSFNDLLK